MDLSKILNKDQRKSIMDTLLTGADLPKAGMYIAAVIAFIILSFVTHFQQYTNSYTLVYDEIAATRIGLAEKLRRLPLGFFGMCCEMEGGAIAQACYLNDTPFVIIRAISDKADDSEEMNYELFKKDAAGHCASVVRYMIAHD